MKLPPQNLDAERSVLGSLLLMPEAMDAIDLKPDEFYREQHQRLYATISTMWQEGCRALDIVTVSERLESDGTLAEVGGAAGLAEILEVVPHASHVRYYAGIVRAKAKLRAIINACTTSIEQCYDSTADDPLPELEAKLLGIRDVVSHDIATMDEAVNALEDMEQNPAAVHATGLVDLDQHLKGGLRDGQFVIVGGRPGSGKSVLSGQIAAAFAQRGEAASVISLEMTRAELAERWDASMRREDLRRLPVFISDSACEISRITALIRLAKRKHNIQLAVLDYLQLTETSGNVSRERQVAEVSRACKRLAMELRIPIVAACQLNRASDKEQRDPRLSDLRESGSIEQDADIVLLLSRGDDGEAKIIVAKQRNGSIGVVHVAFRPEQYRFENASLYNGPM